MVETYSKATIDTMENLTLRYYEENAEAFWSGTKSHDVSQNIQAFLQALPEQKNMDILDFGCGPGRDLMTFKTMGHRPVGLDGCETFCKMAKKYSRCPVLHQHFLQLELRAACFDGIFANASLFHVPRQKLLSVLECCYSALRPEGILFLSNPRGHSEHWEGERYGNFMEYNDSKTFLEQAGFSILRHYYRPEGKPQHQQPWLAIVCQR